jgi:hypothetical protein
VSPHPEWRDELDMLQDERCWSPIGELSTHLLPPRRLDTTVAELRRSQHGLHPTWLAPWELLYAQVAHGG